jgi:hypothetical protein
LFGVSASFWNYIVYSVEKTLKTMETTIEKITPIQKSKPEVKSKDVPAASSCCTPKNNAAVCCTPSETPAENNGACCAQPEVGSSCCDK